MDCSPPGSSVHGILQARILEWVAISFSRGSSRPRDQTQVSHIAGRCFKFWATNWIVCCVIISSGLKEKNHLMWLRLGSVERKKKSVGFGSVMLSILSGEWWWWGPLECSQKFRMISLCLGSNIYKRSGWTKRLVSNFFRSRSVWRTLKLPAEQCIHG